MSNVARPVFGNKSASTKAGAGHGWRAAAAAMALTALAVLIQRALVPKKRNGSGWLGGDNDGSDGSSDGGD